MSQVLAFPVRDTMSRYRLESVRRMAARAGADVHKVAGEFIAAGCSKAAQNDLAERYRRHTLTSPGGDVA
ncbi:hypothetical protein SOM22_08470 [Stenotrophomonas rhizophila]|uniref:hypothetical protein n=1 Tax=Stenotrophomonas rhizophila TaxID=216778 RepID=UPI002A6A32D0|nr:hypothetical protein [Stenotrophomonas rhizophila]MDY0954608.1 hypothetical protein [Stenotrophomonas rhizophila]